MDEQHKNSLNNSKENPPKELTYENIEDELEHVMKNISNYYITLRISGVYFYTNYYFGSS